ncbi:runt-related transcription factor 2-like isoform X2 [Phacochoerus africanus]|uniref:runt-related transcription factor 2-like isoform X2 n=1 Tax=Phacochoerus africanus TaxID=41426 RepID=UPI001FD9EA08|nr:runt-related transcription factor 2-like isoform X2 [Phacochoerus africanus]
MVNLRRSLPATETNRGSECSLTTVCAVIFKAASRIYNRGYKFYLKKKGGTMASNSLFSTVTPCQQNFFWGEETEVQRGFLNCPRTHHYLVIQLGPKLRSPDSWSRVLSTIPQGTYK